MKEDLALTIGRWAAINNVPLKNEVGIKLVSELEGFIEKAIDDRMTEFDMRQSLLSKKPWFKEAFEIHQSYFQDTWSPNAKRFLALSLAGEVGELCNTIKKEWRGDGKIDFENCVEEIADCYIYLTLIAFAFDMDHIDPFINRKLKQFKERKTND